MDINGNAIPPNVIEPSGKQRGLTKGERQRMTHFLDADSKKGDKNG